MKRNEPHVLGVAVILTAAVAIVAAVLFYFG